MDVLEQNKITSKNWILNSLPKDSLEQLLPHLKPTSLPKGDTLYIPDGHIQYVYFVNSGMVSLVSVTEGGATIEVGLVGYEGMVGIPIILGSNKSPYQAEVQVEGDALKMKAEVIREEFSGNSLLRGLLLRYTYILLAQLSQSALCNRFHTMEERLCRWLLVTCDRVKSPRFKLTQEDLSHMMGSHRPNVSVAARSLQQAGLIHYSRGQVTILDAPRLEESACECYRILSEKFNEFLSLS